MIFQIGFGDGRGGGYRIEWNAEAKTDADVLDSVVVLRRAGSSRHDQWKPVAVFHRELLPDEYRTVY